ncbi:SnoaL-like domain-containing protein [Cladophialophora immunda]|nr:SnoaL-like domain-containing protein [Cladophialophora immunda]
MAFIKISPERIALVDSTIRKLVDSFLKPITSIADFTSIFHPDIDWYDHAFLMHRAGHDAVVGLQKGFTHCNQPFNVDIKAIIPTPTGAVLEQVWVGRQANDIIRPNGDVVVKASGKDFECHVCMLIEVDDGGLITRIDEYYNRNWDNGIREQQYALLKGASLRSKA